MQVLVSLGYALPELLACGIAIAMLWSGAQAGRARSLGLWGICVMLACAFLQLGLGLYQALMISQLQGDSASDPSRMFALLGSVRLVLNCAWLAGVLLVVQGLCLATRVPRA